MSYRTAVRRQSDAILAALLTTWTGLPVALWLALFGGIAGAFIGAVGGAELGIARQLHVSGGASFGGAFAGFFVGALFGFILIYKLVINHPLAIVGDLVSGVVVAALSLWVIVHFEDALLRARGYRRPTRRERELVEHTMNIILTRIDYPVGGPVPRLYISDVERPEAWTHANAIVFAKGLFDYDESENPPTPRMAHPQAFAAIAAHEMTHWVQSDGLATRAVWACCWPIIVWVNLCYLVGRQRGAQLPQSSGISPQSVPKGLAVGAGWIATILFWPLFLSVKYVIGASMNAGMRKAEYQADQGAALLGEDFRLGLRNALTELKDWEAPRTGWEDTLLATHPTIEERLDALETPVPGIEGPDEESAIGGTRPQRPWSDDLRPRIPEPPPEPPPEPVAPIAETPAEPDPPDERWHLGEN